MHTPKKALSQAQPTTLQRWARGVPERLCQGVTGPVIFAIEYECVLHLCLNILIFDFDLCCIHLVSYTIALSPLGPLLPYPATANPMPSHDSISVGIGSPADNTRSGLRLPISYLLL